MPESITYLLPCSRGGQHGKQAEINTSKHMLLCRRCILNICRFIRCICLCFHTEFVYTRFVLFHLSSAAPVLLFSPCPHIPHKRNLRESVSSLEAPAARRTPRDSRSGSSPSLASPAADLHVRRRFTCAEPESAGAAAAGAGAALLLAEGAPADKSGEASNSASVGRRLLSPPGPPRGRFMCSSRDGYPIATDNHHFSCRNVRAA